ncbi:AcrR family transcriptional regulator [Parvibaculum indicum]|uniref:TetR/AcrR family transcriptional regulator n=1 Tax=Parvibaculum indicum TaxID=562969 RepID=UPI0014205045|nr:TetR/AcrR family transcriptional regulator [Parvibaculum indicum]NIJ41898.1 AcrR family transcriptional regulator [Parvibaculum indicum]
MKEISVPESLSERPVVEPRQRRAKATYRSLLGAAQQILAEEGLEALNSNAIVERAGLTAPTFYRYFEDKHAILAVLGRELMEAQNAALETAAADMPEAPGELARLSRDLLRRTLEITETFEGGYALMVSLRAIPSLRPIRLASHAYVAEILTGRFLEAFPEVPRADAYDRCRLSVEIGYAAVEMLLETAECDRERVLERTAEAVRAAIEP